MGKDGIGLEWRGTEWLFFPPSQKCDCGTSNGWERNGADGRGEDWTGRKRNGFFHRKEN